MKHTSTEIFNLLIEGEVKRVISADPESRKFNNRMPGWSHGITALHDPDTFERIALCGINYFDRHAQRIIKEEG